MTLGSTDALTAGLSDNAVAQQDSPLRQVIDATLDGILVVDADQNIRFANPSAAALFGRPAEELVGEPFGLPIVPDEYAEVNIVTPQAAETVAEMRAVLAKWNDEEVYVISLRDISERRRLEEELRQAHKMEALGNLSGGIAHDFNNLLTSIITCSMMLIEQMSDDDPRRRYAAQVRDVAQRGAALTSQLLTFSRKRVVRPRRLDLNTVVSDMSTMLSRIIGEHIQLTAECADEPAWIMADRSQVEQVIVNLAVNARDAMPEGGTLVCAVSVDRRRHVTLSVRDTGHGMDDEVRARAFEPFFTTKPEGQGTGLGLATVYGIVHQANGQILLRSEPGLGTHVQIALPYADAGRTSGGQRRPSLVAQPARQVGSVLLVEDDEDIRGIVSEVLMRAGWRVVSADTGASALAVLRDGECADVDLVISDVVMPDGGGGELYREVRRVAPTLPFLFISGYPKESLDLMVGDTCVGFLSKPFAPDDLINQASELVERRRSASSAESESVA